MSVATTFDHRIWQSSMIAAPLLLSVSQFFWKNGMVSPTAGWMQVLAFACWLVAFRGMFLLVKESFPRYYTLGLFVAGYACIGGAGFGFDGIYLSSMGFQNLEQAEAFHNQVGTPLIPALFLPGALFPLSLLVLGVQLIRAKQIQPWIGILLILAGVGFPLSRIPRIDLIAHLDNILLLASHLLIVWKKK